MEKGRMGLCLSVDLYSPSSQVIFRLQGSRELSNQDSNQQPKRTKTFGKRQSREQWEQMPERLLLYFPCEYSLFRTSSDKQIFKLLVRKKKKTTKQTTCLNGMLVTGSYFQQSLLSPPPPPTTISPHPPGNMISIY